MVICVDTTTSNAGISLISAEKPLGYLPSDPKNASNSILGNIDELLKSNNVDLNDLEGIMIITGPGSFTGLRVGIAVGNQLAHQLNIPILGLTTDEWYAYRTNEEEVIYAQSMNRDEVYITGKIEKLSEVISSLADKKWMGELSEDHANQLADVGIQVVSLTKPEETWHTAYLDLKDRMKREKQYELIEPYYGKEPTITKSKRKLSI